MTKLLDFLKRQTLLLIILLLGFTIRLINISSRSLQYDDVFSIFLAQRSLAEIVRGTAADTMPPLYYFILHYWLLLGQNVWFIRALSVIFSLAAIWLLYQLTRFLFDKNVALWAAFLAAISPFQFYHAQDIRNYSLLLCEQLAYMLFFVRVWMAHRQNQPIHWLNWLGLVLSGSAALYTHNVSILGLGIPNLVLLFSFLKTQKSDLKHDLIFFLRLALAQAAILLINLPWLILLPAQIAKVQRAWSLTVPGVVDLIQVPVLWITGLPLPGIWLIVGVVLSLEVAVFVVLQVVKVWKREIGIRFLAAITVLLPAIFFTLSFVMKPIFVARGFILSSMAFYALAGWAITDGWRKGAGKLILLGFLIAAGVGIPAQASYSDFPRSPYQQAAEELSKNTSANRIVVHDNKLSYFPFRFYQPGLIETFLMDIPGSGNDTFAPDSQQAMGIYPAVDILSAVGNYQEVEFVAFRVTQQEYVSMGYRHPVLEWLDKNLLFVQKTDYNDLEVYSYKRP